MGATINSTEISALNFLIETKHYSKEQIRRGKGGEPDFCCSDGKRYEIKKEIKKALIFTKKQMEEFKTNDVILVFTDSGFSGEFLWKNRKMTKYHIIVSTPSLVDIDDKLKEKMQRYVERHETDYPTMKNFLDRTVTEKFAFLEAAEAAKKDG